MFDIILIASDMLKNKTIKCEEILEEFSAEYKILMEDVPTAEAFLTLCTEVPEEDSILVRISDGSRTVAIDNSSVWIDDYNDFISGLYPEDNITVSIKISKGTSSHINVYNFAAFSNFLIRRKYRDVLELFATLFSKYGNRLVFHVLDENISIRTQSIMFSDNADFEWREKDSRQKDLQNCAESSVFLDRTKYSVVPQDFTIEEPVEGKNLIGGLFTELQRIMSYIYVANTSSFMNDKVVLGFDPVKSPDEYDISDLTKNPVIYKIFQWIFKDEGSVDRASIARKIINVYCHDKNDILNIGEDIFNSIRSDYVIYQKNHADQYIGMKNKISDCIIDNVKQLQELSHDISESFRNNFVGVIVFVMTVLLTDTIDFSQFTATELSSNVKEVCILFTVVSAVYLIATYIMSQMKWNWIDKSYQSLKNNYHGILDDKDIEEAFNHDADIEEAKDQFKHYRLLLIILWMIMIAIMAVFTLALHIKR